MDHNATSKDASSWLLSPLCNELNCQFVDSAPGVGVFVQIPPCVSRHSSCPTSVRIQACDGSTKSAIISPLIIRTREGSIGVFDLECLAQEDFDDESGSEKIALAVDACDWCESADGLSDPEG